MCDTTALVATVKEGAMMDKHAHDDHEQSLDIVVPNDRTARLLGRVGASEAAARSGIGGDGAGFVASRRGRRGVTGDRVELALLRRRGPVPDWERAIEDTSVPLIG
jgi:hypothetical protein